MINPYRTKIIGLFLQYGELRAPQLAQYLDIPLGNVIAILAWGKEFEKNRDGFWTLKRGSGINEAKI